MNDGLKIIVGGLAIIGGAVVGATIMSRYLTVGIYSPYIPQYDIIKIRGSTLFKLIATGGGDTPPQASGGLPFPIGMRIKWFDDTPSLAEEAYKGVTGSEFDFAKLFQG